MKRFVIVILAALIALPLWSQSPKRGRSASKAKTTQTTKKQQPAKKKQTKKTQTAAKPVDKKRQLQNERAATEQKRRASQQQADQLNRSIRNTLDSVIILNQNIAARQHGIDTLNIHLTSLNHQLTSLNISLDSLRTELAHKQSNYNCALRYMQRHRTSRQKLIYIFSAPTLEQTVRRAHQVRRYSSYQQAQGALIKQKQQEMQALQERISDTKNTMESQRTQLQQQQQLLQQQKTSQQEKVTYLNRNLATVQQQVQEYRKREAALNAEIDRIIQAEIAAEAKRKAEAEARRKAEAERKRKAEAEAARKKAEAAKQKQAEANKKPAAGGTTPKPSTPAAAKPAPQPAAAEKPTEWKDADDADTRLSASFTANKGRLPMPVTGSYSIVGHYGQYNVNGLSNVTLDNKGIDIRCQQGASARAVFNGTVSSVFQYGGTTIVMIRHGDYISVYSGLQSASVRKGATVSTRQSIGTIARDDNGNYVLHFQLRKLSARLNPEQWLGR